MTTIAYKETVFYTAIQMYQLINDVAAYPQFLPWCTQTKILEHTEHTMTAQITVKEVLSFTTKNTFTPYSRVELNLVAGPFKNFHGQWQLTETEAGQCEISLELEFAFSNTLLKLAFSHVFEKIGRELIAAFIQRAKDVYEVPSLRA